MCLDQPVLKGLSLHGERTQLYTSRSYRRFVGARPTQKRGICESSTARPIQKKGMKRPMTENTENGGATSPSGPIEVWIRQKKAATFTCMVVSDDESTYEFDLVSRTLAAAQQEVTGRLLPGYQAAGGWSPVETSRTFLPGLPRRGRPRPRRRVLNTSRER